MLGTEKEKFMVGTPVKLTKENFDAVVDEACLVLRNGGVIVYPTDTVYGIGGDATRSSVVDQIYELKRIRASERHFSIMVSDLGMIKEYCEVGQEAEKTIRSHLPGSYTIILKINAKYGSPPLPVSDSKFLGIRIPDSRFCQALCKKFGKPIITTSANITSKPAPTRFEEIDRSILECTFSIDDGPTKYQKASDIIDLSGKEKTIRKRR